MQVWTRMTRKPMTVDLPEMLAVADARMRTGKFLQMPVLDSGRLVGILSAHDLERFRGCFESVPVSAAMTAHPITISFSASLEQAAALLSKHSIDALPVLDGGKLIGIITAGDLAASPTVSKAEWKTAAENEAPAHLDDDRVRIVRVVIEAMSAPSGPTFDGPYDVPFQLSRVTSTEWEHEFLKSWDRHAAKSNRGKASVGADRIVISSTTIDDVERVHLVTLKQALDEANRATTEAQERLRERARIEEQRRREHLKHVEQVIDRLNFDD
jgi:predicted transcriptional regulator